MKEEEKVLEEGGSEPECTEREAPGLAEPKSLSLCGPLMRPDLLKVFCSDVANQTNSGFPGPELPACGWACALEKAGYFTSHRHGMCKDEQLSRFPR
ncbi:hypothetical protein AOLI_G00025250 [Acnodon oligacanthus]